MIKHYFLLQLPACSDDLHTCSCHYGFLHQAKQLAVLCCVTDVLNPSLSGREPSRDQTHPASLAPWSLPKASQQDSNPVLQTYSNRSDTTPFLLLLLSVTGLALFLTILLMHAILQLPPESTFPTLRAGSEGSGGGTQLLQQKFVFYPAQAEWH